MIKLDMAEKLWETLESILIDNSRGFISVNGGGGKTTFLVSFSTYLKNKGYSVLITTSTKLASPYSFNYNTDRVFLSPQIISYWPRRGESVFYGRYDEAIGKTIAPSESIVSLLYERYDVVIVEADGSRRLPLKIHTERDPVIWSPTSSVVSISGLWSYGKRVEDSVFGEERKGLYVDKSYFDYLTSTPRGMMKGMRKDTKNVFLFNGGDEVGEDVREKIKSIKLPLLAKGFIVSLNEERIYESL